MTPADPLAPFHPLTAAWFRDRVGDPTPVQRLAWPRIAGGEHVLATAPTGSGKTLAAFMWALDRLLSGAWEGGRPRVLYVSPLKALNADIARNLTAPLRELSAAFAAAGEGRPSIRVAVRSGDTPQDERRRMLRQPPEILVTTPESLNILLTSRSGRELLSGLATVMLDEVHAVVGSKRGVHLITAVERLVPLAGEVQRLGLSATVRPLERVAAWMGGYALDRGGAEPTFRRRRVTTVEAPSERRVELAVRFPAAGDDAGVWDPLVREIRATLRRRRSTLVFANSRRMVEKLTRLVNEDAGTELAWSHHGSLSREIRAVVEERLKAGELKGIVATSSLELGIDIGALEEVVLVQTPPSVASAVQRIGRSGHAVGAVSRGLLLPLVARDLLDAAVVADAVREGAIEEVRPVTGALDVLAQVVVSMTCAGPWAVDDLFDAVRAADPYRELPRRQFDLVLEMLAGRYADLRVREARPLISLDRLDGTVRARPGAERLVYMAGGTIPDRGYFRLRDMGSGALIGELDEEFVWERSVGDTFTLGVQSWRIEQITHNDVLVSPSRSRAAMAPFWRAEEQGRSFELSQRLGDFVGRAEALLDDLEGFGALARHFSLDTAAATSLRSFLAEQRAATGVLPTRHRVVVERVQDPQTAGDVTQVVIHTLWGGRVNRPFAVALAAAWERRYGTSIEVVHDDDAVLVDGPAAADLVGLVTSADVEALLREHLERTGFFGARFREAAGRALLLPREGFSRRTPLWLSRQRAKTLLEAVARFDDHPLVLEAWRECLQDEIDLEALRTVLDGVANGSIQVSTVVTSSPSPFAASASWKRTNRLMYEDDTPVGGGTRVRSDLLREVAFAAHLRPRLAPELVDALARKLQRTFPGYAPGPGRDLLDWVVERVAVPGEQWDELLAAVRREHGAEADPLAGVEDRVATVASGDAGLVVAVEMLPRVLAALELPPEAARRRSGDRLPALPAPRPVEGAAASLAELVADLLRFEGPVPVRTLAVRLGLPQVRVDGALEALVDDDRVVVDELTAGAGQVEVCDADNLERLLRIARAGARPALEPLPADRIPLFLAHWQRLAVSGASLDDLQQAMERLIAFSAPAELWEAEMLPARLDPYHPAWLDAVLAGSALQWVGTGDGRITFVFAGEEDVAVVPGAADEAVEDEVLPAGPGRFAFEDLVAASGVPSAELTGRLWRAAWQGTVVNDTFEAVRQGIASRFRPARAGAGGDVRGGRIRARRQRWASTRPFAGTWRRLPGPVGPADALEAEELARERVRVLLDRYGVLFRELLDRELPQLSWRRLFRTLRLMELSGEVVTGRFFEGVGGIQFASPAAVRRLRDGLPEDLVWWLDAADPASPCGLAVAGLPAGLPRRVATSHLVFHGARLVLVSERRGRRLQLNVSPDDPELAAYLRPLANMLLRPVLPLKTVTVEEVNGTSAAASPFRPALEAVFHVTRDRDTLRLGRRW